MLSGEATFRYVMLPRHKRRYNDRKRRRRDAFREMLESVVANGHTFDECKELLKKCTPVDIFSLRLCVGGLIDHG